MYNLCNPQVREKCYLTSLLTEFSVRNFNEKLTAVTLGQIKVPPNWGHFSWVIDHACLRRSARSSASSTFVTWWLEPYVFSRWQGILVAIVHFLLLSETNTIMRKQNEDAWCRKKRLKTHARGLNICLSSISICAL